METLFASKGVCVCMRMHVRVCVHARVCMRVCMRACMHACACVCVCAYTHTYDCIVHMLILLAAPCRADLVHERLPLPTVADYFRSALYTSPDTLITTLHLSIESYTIASL